MKISLSPSIEVELLPEKAVLWDKTLIVADLHWGKTEAFQQHGIPIPSNLLAVELERLLDLSERKRASRIIVLGDLVHAPEFLGSDVLEQTRSFFKRGNFKMILVEGNHDRRLKLPEDWNLKIVQEPFCEKGLAFTHHPDVKVPLDHYTWSGHLHPTVALEQGKDRLRLPCFIVGKSQGIVPAFSDFTRGVIHSVYSPERPDRRFFAIADENVIEV
jgi:DNA ligase-associated metallophosphoesterase